jgi:hypothetical protein
MRAEVNRTGVCNVKCGDEGECLYGEQNGRTDTWRFARKLHEQVRGLWRTWRTWRTWRSTHQEYDPNDL